MESALFKIIWVIFGFLCSGKIIILLLLIIINIKIG